MASFKNGNKYLHSRTLYLGKVSFKKEGKIKTLSDEQMSREFFASRPILQEMIKAALQPGVSGKNIRCYIVQ